MSSGWLGLDSITVWLPYVGLEGGSETALNSLKDSGLCPGVLSWIAEVLVQVMDKHASVWTCGHTRGAAWSPMLMKISE